MKLIPEWRVAWKFWSVQLAALGTLVTGVLISFPDAALAAWALLPWVFSTASLHTDRIRFWQPVERAVSLGYGATRGGTAVIRRCSHRGRTYR